MEEIKFDIIEYLGKIEDAIFVLLSLSLDGEFYEGVFCYRDDVVALTTQSELEEKLGSNIEDWGGYSSLMLNIIPKVVPYKEILNRIDSFDESQYKIIYPE